MALEPTEAVSLLVARSSPASLADDVPRGAVLPVPAVLSHPRRHQALSSWSGEVWHRMRLCRVDERERAGAVVL